MFIPSMLEKDDFSRVNDCGCRICIAPTLLDVMNSGEVNTIKKGQLTFAKQFSDKLK